MTEKECRALVVQYLAARAGTRERELLRLQISCLVGDREGYIDSDRVHVFCVARCEHVDEIERAFSVRGRYLSGARAGQTFSVPLIGGGSYFRTVSFNDSETSRR